MSFFVYATFDLQEYVLADIWLHNVRIKLGAETKGKVQQECHYSLQQNHLIHIAERQIDDFVYQEMQHLFPLAQLMSRVIIVVCQEAEDWVYATLFSHLQLFLVVHQNSD